MSKITRFYENVEFAGAESKEFTNIISGIKYIHSGYIDQVTVVKSDGSDTTMDIQIRYIAGSGDLHKLVYYYDSAEITSAGFVDSIINAPFSCSKNGTDGDIHLFLESAAACTVNVRIDIDLHQ